MKKMLVCIIFMYTNLRVYAQEPSDSLAYQLQRKKINTMLDQRRQTFGQYDQSLGMHTGIFGLQTKKDIRRSNDILMQIVKTDDEIFRQLKILLDYRAFQQTQAVNHSHELEDNSLAYMAGINKLRNELDKAKKDAEQAKQQQLILKRYLCILAVLLLSILFLLSRKRAVRA